ncbi:MAG TPA: carboxypeptidase-like regulatory domain-containing protein, partial [Fibrobacteria bacterium]|nr:carboxypeptidase-like regulatory domain-containing protein [Fibrobacteria bacterium]
VVTLQDVQGGPLHTGVTDASGEFEIKAPPGDYVVNLATLGLRPRDVRTLETPAGGAEHELTVEAFAGGGGAEGAEDPLELAFVRDIEVTSNEIGEMGLSGIGVPYLAPRPIGVATPAFAASSVSLSSALLLQAFGQMGGFAIGLSIHRNRIRRCLRNVFTEELLERARAVGLGGISLGLCERLSINENIIEDNGRGHVNPVCGIYVAYANRADIVENRIANNGALDPAAQGLPREGQRGGIVVKLAAALSLEEILAETPPSSPTVGLSNFATAARQTLPKGQFALRVLDNSVQHPLNRSLQALAMGPVMVHGNFFHTDAAFAGTDQVMMAGTLYLINLGRPGATQGRAVLPGGQTLVNDNQIQLGFAVNCNSSQLILTLDDLGMDGNQSEVDQENALVTHTAVLAGTVRASGNRYQEPKREGSFKISLYTLGAMLNNTVHNQGDHCTVALCSNAARPAIDVGNQVTGSVVDPCRVLNLILGQALVKT